MITIKNDTTTSTDVCPNAERFLHDGATIRTFLAGEMGWDRNHSNSMQKGVAVDPLEEDAPSGIMDRFGEFAILDHVLKR
jgi:hypothetical protein